MATPADLLAGASYVDIATALDDGPDAVIEWIAERADDYCQDISPIYKAAVLTCQTLDTTSQFGCDSRRRALRFDIVKDIALATQLYAVIQRMCDAWHTVPAVVRDNLALGVAMADAAISLISHPSTSAALSILAGAATTYASTAIGYFLPGANSILTTATGWARIASNWIGGETDHIVSALQRYGLLPPTDIISRLAATATGSSWGALLTVMAPAATLTLAITQDIGAVASNIGHDIGQLLPWNW